MSELSKIYREERVETTKLKAEIKFQRAVVGVSLFYIENLVPLTSYWVWGMLQLALLQGSGAKPWLKSIFMLCFESHKMHLMIAILFGYGLTN